MRLIDLSTTIANNPSRPPLISYTDHAQSAIERGQQFNFDPAQLPIPGVHMAADKLNAVVHATATHVDSPYHYGPTSEGKPSRAIDELPLEWFYGDGVVLDFSQIQDGGVLTVDDIKAALGDYALKPLDIVLMRTDMDKSTDPQKGKRQRELGRAAAEYLLDQGVKVVGVDAISADKNHFEDMKAGHPEAVYPAHMLGREREYCLVEMLTNLEQLPHHGFKVALFPIKIEKGSGGWCRAVAFLDD